MQGVIDHARSKRPSKKRKVPAKGGNNTLGSSPGSEHRNVKSREALVVEPTTSIGSHNSEVLAGVTEALEHIVSQIEAKV